MPTYEYVCRDCGHTFDIVQSMKDDSLTACPECGGELRKVFHAAAISFKGSGFYATDSRKKASSATSSPGEKSDKAGEKKDASSSESSSSSDKKSEKKTETKTSETTTSTSKKETKP